MQSNGRLHPWDMEKGKNKQKKKKCEKSSQVTTVLFNKRHLKTPEHAAQCSHIILSIIKNPMCLFPHNQIFKWWKT